MALGTALFFVFALGLLVEGVLAWRNRRVLRGRVALQAFGLGTLGLVTVLQESLGAGHDVVRQVSGVAVAAAFLACGVVDIANRQRLEAHS